MFRIGEFSQMAQVTIRTLRHYDEIGLLKPVHIDRFTDYRYYTIEQLPRLNRILALKDLGFSLEQIARSLRDDVSPEQLRGMFMLKQAEIEQQLQEEHMRLARVAARLRQIEQEGKQPEYDVVLKQGTQQTLVSLRKTVPTIEAMPLYRCAMYNDLYIWLEQRRIKQVGQELALYHNDGYFDENIDMETGVIINKAPLMDERLDSKNDISIHELPASNILASVVHRGNFYDVPQAVTALFMWVGENGYTASGPYREIHLFGRENDLTDFEHVTLEMQLPIEKR